VFRDFSQAAFALYLRDSTMSAVATPTLLPREPKFPHCLPKPPQPHPIPLSRRQVYGHLNAVRDLQREMDDLSDEENELEDLVHDLFILMFLQITDIGELTDHEHP
jgi:hypothetical protein